LKGQNPKLNIFRDFKISVDQTLEFKSLAKFKILESQNPKFKILKGQAPEFRFTKVKIPNSRF